MSERERPFETLDEFRYNKCWLIRTNPFFFFDQLMSNRLANESSPYLLQHRDNPVEWYPWGAEALLKARAEDKPIFLSIGYSACHWCHVMEHESFENDQIAAYLNEHFVSIKVDREERPDLDQIYMQAVMAMHGHGGWPLSAFLSPDQDFFFGGTYWPPSTTAQMPGFDRVLASVLDAYHNKRDQIIAQSKQITEMIRSSDADKEQRSAIDPGILHTVTEVLHNRWDSTYGGFGNAPKFPHPMDLSLLLNLIDRNSPDDAADGPVPNREQLLEMVEVTLTKMAGGGIYDHLAGGFARYSVDARWLVPHFEKMLYDNALLARVYLHAFQVTGDLSYSRTCEETLDYLRRYMTDPKGAIYSTEDADSEGVEGKFYVWTVDEVIDVLGKDVGSRFCELYNVTPAGNFEGENILNLPISIASFAEKNGDEPEAFAAEMKEARATLLTHRDQRVRPGRDDKVITSWNGLAIAAFADAAVVLENPGYAEAATKAAEFVWENLRDEQGRLLHTWRTGTAKLSAYLDDYACLANAFVSLYRVAFDEKWITRANELVRTMLDHFHDPDSGAFYYTADDHEQLIARIREFQDSAVPSGNSMAATALLRLGRIQGDNEMVDLAYSTMLAAMPLIERSPMAASQMLVAIESWFNDSRQYVLMAGSDPQQNEEIVQRLQKSVKLDRSLIVVRSEASTDASRGPFAALLSGKQSLDGQPTLLICEQSTCSLPIVGMEEIVKAV